jgi:short-subunit dehydrogenase
MTPCHFGKQKIRQSDIAMKIDHQTVAAVTGAASGIGRALALRLARAGASLALADVNRAGLAETAHLLGNAGINVSTHDVDVSDRLRVAEFADEVCETHGRCNLLINNAGVGLIGNFDEISLEDFEWLMGVNFNGALYGTHYFLPMLKAESAACVVNISSIFGIIAPIGMSAYCASKFAVRGFSEVLRHELRNSSVQVLVVHPGGISTPIAVHARLGEKADKQTYSDAAERFARVARTSPEAAAERIVRGIEAGKGRVLIGADARALSLIQKFFPARYWHVIGGVYERMMY